MLFPARGARYDCRVDQPEALYVVRSWHSSTPDRYGISRPMSRSEAEKLVSEFKSGRNAFYLEAKIEKYIGQEAGNYGPNTLASP